MALTELQLGLVALGGAAVAGVLAYNKWQERKYRKNAEEVFRVEHADVLLEPAPAAPAASGRIEPVLGDVAEDDVPPQAGAEPEPLPEIGAPLVDAQVDGVIRFEAAEPVTGASLWHAQQEVFGPLAERLRWFAWSEPGGGWQPVSAHTAAEARQLRLAFQLADRTGPLSDEDLDRIYEGAQRLADRFLAVIEAPERLPLRTRAHELDSFCAGVDVQIAVNLVSKEAAGFSGTKLRGVVEAAGLSLDPDGTFHYRDDAGITLFTLGNLEPALFAADEMRTLTTHGLTFTLDVPRVPQGVAAFQRMVALAGQLAGALGGTLVDDNRAPLNEKSLQFIRSKIEEFQRQMAGQGFPAGSPGALRLFS